MDPIVGKLLATAVVRGGTETKRRVARRLREQQYSAELGPVETVFNDTLEAELRAVAKRSGNDELLSIAFNWGAFAPELDSLDVLVEEEAEVIDRIASTIVGMEDTAEHYERALEINAEDMDAPNSYATLLEEEGETVEATEHYERALEIDPGIAEFDSEGS